MPTPRLHQASCTGDVEIVKNCLDSGDDVNESGDIEIDGTCSPLHWVCAKGHVECLQELLKSPSIDLRSVTEPKGRTCLHVVCHAGHIETLRELLRYKPVHSLINLQDKNGETPLHIACALGRIESVRSLLDIPSIDISIQDNSARTAYQCIGTKMKDDDMCKRITIEHLKTLMLCHQNTAHLEQLIDRYNETVRKQERHINTFQSKMDQVEGYLETAVYIIENQQQSLEKNHHKHLRSCRKTRRSMRNKLQSQIREMHDNFEERLFMMQQDIEALHREAELRAPLCGQDNGEKTQRCTIESGESNQLLVTVADFLSSKEEALEKGFLDEETLGMLEGELVDAVCSDFGISNFLKAFKVYTSSRETFEKAVDMCTRKIMSREK